MWREAMDELLDWKDRTDRKPLMLRGVRQSGKTYLMKEFGNRCFGNVLYLNLERDRRARTIFQKDLDPFRISRDLESIFRIPLRDGESILILDEVQSCPEAVTSLKYFCEERAGLHVIAAGSLLGVLLAEKTSYPVGKVDLMTLRPMNFREWLTANGRSSLYENADSAGTDVSEAVLSELDEEYRKYLFVGGMPEAVQKWIDTHDEEEVTRIQDNILASYAADFLKHVPDDMAMKVNRVWTSVPEQLAQDNGRFFYNHVRGSGRAKELEDAVEWLTSANLLYRVNCTEGPTVPLAKASDGTRFKLYVCDCGLLSRMMDVSLPMYLYDDLNAGMDSDFRGAAAENYVLEEIVSSTGREPFYWKDGKYEVDFLIRSGMDIVPVEVKSGNRVRAASLKNYIDRYDPRLAIVVSRDRAREGRVVSVPLCTAWRIRGIAESAYRDDVHPV